MRPRISCAIRFAFAVSVVAMAPGASAQDQLLPKPVKPSDLELRLDLVGQMPTHISTSPVVVGSQLLLFNFSGYIYRWDGASGHDLLTPASMPPDITLDPDYEAVLNVAADAMGTSLYVMFTSSTVPDGIPKRISPRAEGDSDWQVLYHYDFNGTVLSNPRAITALQVSGGHTGGGLVLLDDGSLLFATGDNGDAWEDGRSYSQDATNHLGKILRIQPTDGSTQVVALGVRNVQRLVLYPDDGHVRVDFADIGGWLAEEIDSISLPDLLAEGSRPNFGWGRNADDGRAREGTFYIDECCNPVGTAPRPEPGFLQPVAEFGREDATFIAVSGPVSSGPSFSRITSLFGDLTGGFVYAIMGPLQQTEQDVFRVNLVDSAGQPITLNGLAGGQRSDPRFFNFPDGTAGVLLKATGNFYRLTETR